MLKLSESQLSIVRELLDLSPEPKDYSDVSKRTLETLRRLGFVTYQRNLDSGRLVARLSRSSRDILKKLEFNGVHEKRTEAEIFEVVKTNLQRRTDWGLKELANASGITTNKLKPILETFGVSLKRRKPGPTYLRQPHETR